MRRHIHLAIVVGLIALAWACGGGAAPQANRTAGPRSSGAGSIIITMPDGSLAEISVADGFRRTLMKPAESGGFLLYPSVSPDGARITYVSQAPPGGVGSVADSGFDLWIAARDGSKAKMIFRHESPNQQVTYPQWIDAQHLLAIVQEHGANGVVLTLDRFDITGGARTKVVPDVLAFGVSSDGLHLALTELSDVGGLTLSVTDAAGLHGRTLLSPADRLSPFGWPRFSPDGSHIAFAAAEALSVRSNTGLIAFAPPQAPARDGAPQDIWTVPTRGGTAQRVGDLKEDNPALAWSGDGKRVYANGIKGIFAINLANGAVDRLADGVFHAHIAWAP